MFNSNPIEVDREEKKISIVNNRKLYQFIKSGAAAVVVPRMLMHLEALGEAADAALGPMINLLSLILEAAYQHTVHNWDLAHVITGSVSGSATTSSSITGTICEPSDK